MGIAGDMLMGALLELVPDKNDFINQLNTIGIPKVTVTVNESVKCGIVGTHVNVSIDGEEEHSHDIKHEGHDHQKEYLETHNHEVHMHEAHSHNEAHIHNEGHAHAEAHNHNEVHSHHAAHHHHASMPAIHEIIDNLQVSDNVKKDVLAIYQIIAEAESKVHGKPVSDVHFHEVGMMDAIADITGCALLIEQLEVDKIIASPVKVGFGQVKCAHGILPVPAPATANILIGIPSYAGNIRGELCTPTGAALLKYFVSEFTNMPVMTIEKLGYGMGNKDFDAANCVRAIIGNTQQQSSDQVIELSCNIDDMTAEEIGYATEVLLKNGALDVYTTPIGMKKSRPGILLSVMCKQDNKENMVNLLFRHTTTIGIREYNCNRMILERNESVIDSPYGSIRVKESAGYGIKKQKLEYEDLRKAAEEAGVSIREIKERVKNSKS
jgi:uncharacterized protein (TIGR00299 family) protein